MGSAIASPASPLSSVVAGLRWTTAGSIGNHGIRAAISIVLARLLAPDDFGLLGMAAVVTGFVGIFQTLGTYGAIVQRKDLSPGLLGTLAWLNVAMGVILSGMLAVCAPLLSLLYQSPDLHRLIQLLGLTCVISSFGIVHSALLNRLMRFDRLVQIELTAVTLQGGTAIWLAALGWGAWALVTANLLGTAVTTLLSWRFSPWTTHWAFRWLEARSVMRFSLYLTGVNVLDYLFRNVDKFVIGRWLGPMSLGYYWMAYSLCMVPLETAMRILVRVLLPAFSRLQDDDVQLRAGFLRALGLCSFLLFPVVAGLAATAHPLVTVVLGNRWLPSAPVIILLAPAGVLQTVATLAGNVFMAKGRSDWLFWLNLGSGSVMAGAFFVGLPWGVVGVASAYALSVIPVTYVYVAMAFRWVGLGLDDLLRALAPYAAGSVVMASVVLACRWLLENRGHGPLVVLVVTIPLGVAVYGSIMAMRRPPAARDFARLLGHRVSVTLA